MNTRMVIALTGKKESGKTWVADQICSLDPSFMKVSFATPLKQMVVNSGLCTPDEVYGQKSPYSRRVLQAVGTEIVRAIYPDYWVEQTMKVITSSTKNIIIDDLRFLNEEAMVKGCPRSAVVLVVPEKHLRSSFAKRDSHRSETEMEGIISDYVLVNSFNNNLEGVETLIRTIYQRIATEGELKK